jgi:hypothetical protein
VNWGVYEFPWGTAVRNEATGEWTTVIKSPDGEIINVDGLDVQVTDEGVVFD